MGVRAGNVVFNLPDATLMSVTSRAAPTITGEGPPDPQPALGFDHLGGLPRRDAFNELIVGDARHQCGCADAGFPIHKTRRAA
jgi:hypothetical protein